MAQKKAGPDTQSTAYKRMAPRWRLIDTLLGGTEAMRAAGEDYLPKHAQESAERYKERLQTNVLLNMTELTLSSLSGKPFREPVKASEELPEGAMDDILDDVDLRGNNLDVFARAWFREAFAKAFSHVLVEYPRVAPREDGQPRTLDDDRKENLRPYWVHVPPENVLYAHAEVVNGVEVLTHVRIQEFVTEMGEWEEAEVEQIKVLTPGMVQLYRKSTDKKDAEWKLFEEWATGLDYIPLVTFYTARSGLMEGKPPLLDLAHLNVTHWQSSSDQRSVLTVARFPMLAASGVEEDASASITVGPFQLLSTTAPEGKFYYVEHSGAAIAAGHTDLEALKGEMSSYGGQFLRKKPGGETATARALDSAESMSDLQAMTVSFEDALATALSYTFDWMRLENPGVTFELCKDYDIEETDAKGLDALDKARKNKDISRKALLGELIRRGVLDEDFDMEADATELEDESQKAMDDAKAMLDLDPGQQDDGDNEDDDKTVPPKKPADQGDEE